MMSVSSRAEAYTWMVKHGYANCGACHADPSGGELLTVYGRAMSEAFLSSKFGGSGEGGEEAADSEAKEEQESRWMRRQMARARSRAAGAKLAKPAKKRAAAAPPADEVVEADDVEEPGPKKAGAAAKQEDAEEEEEEGFEEEGGGEEVVEEGGGEEEPAAETESTSEESGSSRAFADPFFGLLPLPDAILLGGSARIATLYNPDAESSVRVFPMQLDLYGELRVSENFRGQASIGVASVKAGSPHARAAQITTNQGDGFRLISRTHWLAFDFGAGSHTIRVGRMNLPFGLRIPEHTSRIRERTETDRESDQQHGLALSMNFEKLRFELMGIAGNYQSSPDSFRERGYSGYLELMIGERAAFGLSSLTTYAKNDRFAPEENRATIRQAHGVFTRVGVVEELAVLAEVAAVDRSRKELGYAGFLQLDFEPAQGLHLIGTVEGANTGYPSNPRRLENIMGVPTTVEQKRVPGTGELQLGYWIGAQWFFAPHFDVRVDAIFRKGDPMQVMSQLHVYL
jgi:hypothetical protein